MSGYGNVWKFGFARLDYKQVARWNQAGKRGVPPQRGWGVKIGPVYIIGLTFSV